VVTHVRLPDPTFNRQHHRTGRHPERLGR
jgi:hypothetical protein